ncbi:MAG: geranylgeranyl reductase family protein [Acidobacteriota bacterium]|nr:geranylgeranyl reductase family protein [Acidobacteriota bacterium]
MPQDYDILIAGAGPAGCAAAYDLARAGRRVLLLDRRNFPRPKACACGLTRKTLKVLRYSVEPIVERVCHEIVLQRASDGAATAAKSEEVRIRSHNPICAMAIRDRFDHFCLQQTVAQGAQLRKIESLAALREFPTHIELDIVVLDGNIQHIETLRSPVLIGADGSNGQARRLAEALSHEPSWYTRGFALEALVPYTALPAKLPGGDSPHDLIFDFSPVPGGYGWLFPKGDHINIGVGAFAPTLGEDGPPKGGAGGTEDRLKAVTRTLLADYARHKLGIAQLPNITGQHLGMGGHAYVPRGRVLLAGDAAGLVDPLTGEGIHSAIVSGQAAAAAILEVLNAETSPATNPGAPCSASGTWVSTELATAYARHLAPLQQTLAFSHRAAQAFYKEPARGFRAMKLPFLRTLVLKTYADGLPHTKLLATLARFV